MTVEMAAAVSAVGQLLAVFVAFLGLGFVGWQIKQARKTIDLQTLQAFLKDAREYERALLNVESDDEREQAFIEFLNFLETYAIALKDGLIPKISYRVIHNKVLDSVSIIWRMPDWHVKIQDAITNPETFEGLGEFIKKNKSEIEALSNLQK